ncbi:hypothetical protein GTNG_3050 [Geobacillus thermodenitrificans NG80-2]|uniref:Uncharacterized protein n=1 Tax=Geobacillus thermodenitrificans (strain NG80-2) TaxID=420246 RepID=A4ISU1_GEOTN|nr:hypothetical protein GTNG_3050 [Geobacillus thermodenitrificans NG80-2]
MELAAQRDRERMIGRGLMWIVWQRWVTCRGCFFWCTGVQVGSMEKDSTDCPFSLSNFRYSPPSEETRRSSIFA